MFILNLIFHSIKPRKIRDVQKWLFLNKNKIYYLIKLVNYSRIYVENHFLKILRLFYVVEIALIKCYSTNHMKRSGLIGVGSTKILNRIERFTPWVWYEIITGSRKPKFLELKIPFEEI